MTIILDCVLTTVKKVNFFYFPTLMKREQAECGGTMVVVMDVMETAWGEADKGQDGAQAEVSL